MKKGYQFLLFSFGLLFFMPSYAESFQAGEDYVVLESPVPTATKNGKVEVAEVFWYGCPHCYDLEAVLDRWKLSLSSQVEFVRVPAFFSDNIWKTHAHLFYTIKSLIPDEKKLHLLHDAIFDEVHKKRDFLETPEKMSKFVVAHSSVTEKKFMQYYHSFGVKMLMNRAAERLKKYKLMGVPAIIVDGKYLVKARSDFRAMLKIVEFLTNKVKQEKGLNR